MIHRAGSSHEPTNCSPSTEIVVLEITVYLPSLTTKVEHDNYILATPLF